MGVSMKHSCYSCGKPATGLFRSVGLTHTMDIWLCAEHVRGEKEIAPPCDNHNEFQHRDGKPPWCNTCGWSHAKYIPATKHKDLTTE